MKIKDIVVNKFNDLPGYKLKGYSEVAVPILKRRVEILTVNKKALPVVEDFVLNLYNEKVSLQDIKLILGIDGYLIDEAFTNLIQRDYISLHEKTITENGLRYLRENSLESLDKSEIAILIDGLTGKIKKYINKFMAARSVKENGIRALKANIIESNIKDIKFKEIKSVFKQYKEDDEETYCGNIVDFIDIKGNTTLYKKIDILIFENENEDVRIVVFDGYNRAEEYEEALVEFDKNGIDLLDDRFNEYFKSSSVIKIKDILKKPQSEFIKEVKYENVNNVCDQYLLESEKNSNIVITIPLVSKYNFKNGFFYDIEKAISRNINLNIILCGEDYIDGYQKKNIEKIQEISKKNENISIIQLPRYINPMILNKKERKALIYLYNKSNISLDRTTQGIVENAFEVKDEDFNNINLILQETISNRDLVERNEYFKDSNHLKRTIMDIKSLVRDADSYMRSNDGIGWIGNGDIPELNMFLDMPVATDYNKFRKFIDSINKSLVESLDLNAKSHSKRNYFWKEFKHEYPKLQKVLDKIRTYRNKSNHLKLDEKNQKKYLKYLNEDLNGYMPEFICNGYSILQYIILNELKVSIKNTIETIK
ncbi:hypothetical protein [Paraclostridium tenue]|uniref:Uncharacterized protein n=1 Tax=Paraclostridium tenue TaxID=1737 RepID=A0ABP3XFS4_9FIRM